MERKYSLKLVLALVFAASALTVLLLSIFILWRMSPSSASGHNPEIIPWQTSSYDNDDFTELMDVITSRFIGTFDVDEITVAAMRAAVESLDDDWSFFMTQDEYNEFLATANNRYPGIGVEVLADEETGGIAVVTVHSGFGADLAGIVVGDIITDVDGQSIRGLALSEIRAMLRRPIDDTVLLTVLRADGRYHDLNVIYSIVFVDPVSFDMLDGNIGYVRLKNFEEGAAAGFISAVSELISQGAVAFVYDVRSNGGGRVGEVTMILDFLLPEGEIFISVNRGGDEQITYSDSNFIDLPAVVLVNSFSFSGAEYFAAMLSEYEYAYTVGEQTTGKNRMQTTIELPGSGGAVHLSTGHYLTKNRVSLYDIGGFTPDYLISLSEDDFDLLRRGELDLLLDPQMQMALSLLDIR